MRRALPSILLGVTAVAGVFAADPVSRVDAARLQAKIEQIAKSGATQSRVPAQTPITEAELNSYLRFELSDRIPAGVKDPWVSLLENDRVSGKATVDFAAVGQARKSSGTLDPFNYLAGALPVTVNGLLRTKSGVGTFSLESASISGVPVPAWMLQEIVSHFSKSSSAPAGVSLEKPFELPLRIQEIRLARGQAIVVQ